MADHLLIDVFDGMKAKSGTVISRFFTRRLEVRNMMYFRPPERCELYMEISGDKTLQNRSEPLHYSFRE